MTRKQILTGGILSLTLALEMGCKHASAPTNQQSKYTQDAIAAGGTLNSDGSVTNPNGTITEPNGNVVTATSVNGAAAPPQGAGAPPPAQNVSAANQPPAASTPSTSAPPAPVALTVPAGTDVTIRTNEEISASRDPDGTRFTGVLERPVEVHHQVIYERGTPVAGVVVAEKRKGEFAGQGDLGIELTAIGRQTVRTSEYVLRDKGRGKRTGAFIGGGGGLGALIGGLAGGGRGALIGGLAGAGAGTAASTTGSKDVIIRPESVITFRLREAVTR
jgi:hypothetical protein